MVLTPAALLSLVLFQVPVQPDTENSDPRKELPARPSHGLSFEASAHGQGGAVAFDVHASIDRRRLHVGETLTLTLTVHATGEVFKPPQAPDLALHPQAAFAGFDIEPMHPIPAVREVKNTWTFVYKLRPKSVKVREVPSILFMYWDPVVQADSPYLTWPVVETDALPLQVLDRPVLAVPLVVPAAVDRFASGPDLLKRQHVWQRPSFALLSALVLGPPVLGIVWYALWRRWYPDAVEALRRRRTRAARTALRELAGGRGLPPQQRAEQAAAAVARYLQARLDLAVAEPTPTEATERLDKAGVAASAIQQTADFFRACDAARFGGGSPAHLPEKGSAVVLALEAQKWAPSSC